MLVIGFGLVNTLRESIQVAPWAQQGAEEGRLMAHTKNVTRLVAVDASDLHAYLKTTIPYPQAATALQAPTEQTWETFAQNSISVDPVGKHVLVLPGGDRRALGWALPALYYAFYYGSPIVFVHEGAIDPVLSTRYADRKAFLIGPSELVPASLGEGFRQAERIAAATPQALAVQLAEYRDEETEFGWGRTHWRRSGYFHYVVTTPNDALLGLAALPYARSNNASLLYAQDDGSLPAALDRYVWAQRADWFVSPSEGPFRHFWLVSNRISYSTAARLDFAVEKAEYPSMGAIALGPLEALLSLLIGWGLASAVFVWVHAALTLPMVKMPLKIAWALSSLLLPVLGPVLYLNAYRRPAWQDEQGGWHWLRSHSLQSAAATAMGFGYGAPLMIAIGFLFVWFGFPIFFPAWLDGAEAWLGAGMPLMMFFMLVLAIGTAWVLVQYPMKQSMMSSMPRPHIWRMALITTFFSMLAVSLGMMTSAWYMLMDHIPMMPKEDDLLWFGSLWLASFIGFLAAWPLNWIMIRRHLKPGNL
ncbi:protein of unknown function [Catalinimonas alkaloidigena]|uniref:DUF4396 domain-containing protein n=2 Tax=Catalinimonas alkaloidigena TaxID=1075417 RepID=A0A1G9U5N3_9BACT|nr:protein of unknown function [Catalinimonas alkaloidigena]